VNGGLRASDLPVCAPFVIGRRISRRRAPEGAKHQDDCGAGRGLRSYEVTTSGASRASHRPAAQRAPDGAPVHYERHNAKNSALYRLPLLHSPALPALTIALINPRGSARPTNICTSSICPFK
jgi:hypothetical protein